LEKEKKKYNLKILNHDIGVVCDDGDEYVDNLYRYILSTVSMYDDSSSPFPMSVPLKALYACVHMADDLFKKNEELLRLEKRLSKEIAKKDKEIEKLKADMDEFISEFDTEVIAKEFEVDDDEK